MVYYLNLFGVAVFAISGALAAGRKRMDLFGVLVLALVTAVGGGTLRDLLLGIHPVFWVSDQLDVYVALIAGVLTFCLARYRNLDGVWLQVADAFGLAIFCVLGTERALVYGHTQFVAVVMGVMTAVAGGMIRDILRDETPLILRKEIYAVAALCGAAMYALVFELTGKNGWSMTLGASTALVLRLAAIKWNLSLPILIPPDDRDG